ncbi:MAG TPA: hypothetical protein VK548_10550 [Candidatus Acidoferrum sp.]|nr:hypothetical protein [Candidatus Acidoferrum sp.]
MIQPWIAGDVALLAAAHVASAQDLLPVQVQGRVAWIAGQTMVVAPDGSSSVNVDLARVPHDQRATLREGDRVAVTGALNNERTGMLAASVQRIGP